MMDDDYLGRRRKKCEMDGIVLGILFVLLGTVVLAPPSLPSTSLNPSHGSRLAGGEAARCACRGLVFHGTVAEKMRIASDLSF